MTVLIQCKSRRENIELETIERKVEILLTALGKDDAELSILLTDDETISSLNKRYLDRDGPTNVISFGQGEPLFNHGNILGDIVVSLETAGRQAETRGVSLTDETLILVVHGLLHLTGHVHDPGEGASEQDELTMQREEARLLSLIGIENI